MTSSTRDTLLDVAQGLLDEGGVDAVTLREVGRLAGLSHNAPYKHFASKQALLAAIAARDLTRRHAAMSAATAETSPAAVLRDALHDYIADALAHPARFKLIFGRWTIDSEELRVAADAAQTKLVEVVAAVQASGGLPAGDPERLAALVRALAHGAADLAAGGHLAASGKGHATPVDLVDDLLTYLRETATAQTRRHIAHGHL